MTILITEFDVQKMLSVEAAISIVEKFVSPARV